MSNNLTVLVVGAGTIAREYVRVLLAIGRRPIVVGRNKEKVDVLQTEFPQVSAYSGGIERWLQLHEPPLHAIVATQIEALAQTTQNLLHKGVKALLVEKPLTYSSEESTRICALAKEMSARVFIAYNRRCYESIVMAKRLIEEDGGVSSFHFDFTEAVFRIDPKRYHEDTIRHWGVANSSHVIDTAFFLCGTPDWIESRQYGNAVPWHPAGSIFTGMGQTIEGIPFTYHANWGSPGRWSIEIMTINRRLFLSPMEQLRQQLAGGFQIEIVQSESSADMNFKPGFYDQVMLFLSGENDSLFRVEDYNASLSIYNKIFQY